MNTNHAGTPSTLAAGGITEVEWGVLLKLTDGVTSFDRVHNRLQAGLEARSSARKFGPDNVEPVWRIVERGPWIPNTVGDEWGVATGWEIDRYREVRECESRFAAENWLACHWADVGGTEMRVVSRKVSRGPWNHAPELLTP